MIQFERYFENIFRIKEITPYRLESFAKDHLTRLQKNNPGGIYNTALAETESALQGFRSDVGHTGTDKSKRKGGVFTKNKARRDFIDYLAQKEGLVKSVFGRKSAPYAEFFPKGINAFRHATDEGFYDMSETVVQFATKYEAQLGSDFRIKLSNYFNAFEVAYNELKQKKGALSTDKYNQWKGKTALQQRLAANLCLVAAHNIDNPDAASLYFTRHLLFPAKKHHLFKGKVEGGQTREVCTFKYSEGKRFHIMVTAAEPMEFQMSLNGNGVGRHVLVKPREKFNESFDFFSSAGDALRVTNPSDKRGSFMVWVIS